MLEKEPDNRIELDTILGMPTITSNAVLKLPTDVLKMEFPLHAQAAVVKLPPLIVNRPFSKIDG